MQIPEPSLGRDTPILRWPWGSFSSAGPWGIRRGAQGSELPTFCVLPSRHPVWPLPFLPEPPCWAGVLRSLCPASAAAHLPTCLSENRKHPRAPSSLGAVAILLSLGLCFSPKVPFYPIR